jgi:hypothetical protein
MHRSIQKRLAARSPFRTFRLNPGFAGCRARVARFIATIAYLHRAGRYDRMSDDVLMVTGQRPLSLQEFVRKNAATFTAPSKAA